MNFDDIKRDDPEAALAYARELKKAGRLRPEDKRMLIMLQTEPEAMTDLAAKLEAL